MNSKTSSENLPIKVTQWPLPGFKVQVQSPRENFEMHLETTLKGRKRVHMVKKG